MNRAAFVVIAFTTSLVAVATQTPQGHRRPPPQRESDRRSSRPKSNATR